MPTGIRTQAVSLSGTVEHHRLSLPPAVVVHPTTGEVTLDVVVAGAESGRGRQVVLSLRWSPDDPLAVEIVVSARPDHPALPRGRWQVLRDFLRYGIDTPTGDGDVRIRPVAGPPQSPADNKVWLELARAGRPCSLAVPTALLSRFLDQTERTVPVGAERSGAMVDEIIARLLQS